LAQEPDAPDSLAIQVRGLVKRFGSTRAVDGLDLEVPRGAFFGLLGPNGAGKTTTVSVLSTLIAPSLGEARVLGHDVVREREAVRADVGLVFQESTLDPELTAREHLDLFARLYHLADRERRLAETLELVGLENDADRPSRELSGGMKRRLEIGRGLLHAPKVLFLDEPTLGLDVVARARVWEHLWSLHDRGETTIFLTTHSMEEAERLCEQVAIIDRGRLVTSGTPHDLKAELGGDVVELALEHGHGAPDELEAVEGVNAVLLESGGGGGPTLFRVSVSDGPRCLGRLVEAAGPFGVIEVTLTRPTLEHVFLHHTGHDLDAPTGGAAGDR
jgi:ABC-2 type transport system ATP-binding protein